MKSAKHIPVFSFFFAILGCAPFFLAEVASATIPLTTHPRIWIQSADLARLRSWAQETNPVYRGLMILVDEAKADMDSTNAPVPNMDTGSREPEYYATEKYAELFAFMSLISASPQLQNDYARRATNLLMHVMNQAVLGPADGMAFRDPGFFTADSNRARTLGEGWPLTVDWIYPFLSAADKAVIHKVFSRWAVEIEQFGYHAPVPLGLTNDPVLFADHSQVRWAANNHFNGNNRNLGLMALAFDPEDDPNNELRNHLDIATGASLYLTDQVMRTDCAGGLFPEGPEYSPQSLAYVAQFLFALETTGNDDENRFGRQVKFSNNVFWDGVLPAYLNTLSPAERINPTFDYLGPIYEPAWYGDSQDYLMPDHINLFGPMALHAQISGNMDRVQALRWVQRNMAAGGEEALPDRVRDSNSFTRGILYYLLLDPTAPEPPDPRSTTPLVYFAPGLGRLLARTSWETNATWFTYKLSWSEIDHQLSDGNQFEFYRRGEWLTKERSGYDLDYGASDNHNTLAVENDDPGRDPDDYRELIWKRGSQWGYGAGGDPTILARSSGSDFIYVLGDATALYNSTYNEVTNVQHVSRSIVWLKPDEIIVYDRASTYVDNRFKRFWLNFPTNAIVAGNRATMTTAGKQQLFVTSLLPAGASVMIETNVIPPLAGQVANGDPMTHRLRVDAPGNPRNARFLHVLESADAGANPKGVTVVFSISGTPLAGSITGDTAVLFPVDIDTVFLGSSYSVPRTTVRHLITGLVPNTGYTLTTQGDNSVTTISLSPGGQLLTDGGGVLDYRSEPVVSLTLNVRIESGSIIVLNLSESVGQTATIETSQDLVKWTDLGSPQALANGQFEYRDPLESNNHRFYRFVRR